MEENVMIFLEFSLFCLFYKEIKRTLIYKDLIFRISKNTGILLIEGLEPCENRFITV